MRKSLALVILVTLGGVASASDYPTAETFLGFTYMRTGSDNGIPSFGMYGGGGQMAANVNRYFGIVADLGVVHNGDFGRSSLDTTFFNFLAGPRFTMRYKRFRPYVNILFGGAHASTSEEINAVPVQIPTQPIFLPGQPTQAGDSPVSLRAVASQTAFAMAVGGGLDIRINKHVNFRPIGLDWMLTHLQNIQDMQAGNQNHLRYTTGVNFTFGAR
jgi:Outer membrane protein beta-barrel domain